VMEVILERIAKTAATGYAKKAAIHMDAVQGCLMSCLLDAELFQPVGVAVVTIFTTMREKTKQ